MITSFFNSFKEIYENKSLTISLAFRDFRLQFVDSYLGVIWAFVQPLTITAVIYFVFTSGVRDAQTTETSDPFILFLVSGIIPWFFFSSALNQSCNVIRQNAYLVRRSGFLLETLPIMKIISASIIHAFLIAIVVLVFVFHGVAFTLAWLQLVYYWFALTILLTGLGFVLSSLTVLVPDVARIVGLITQVLFWVTPIFWNINMLSERWQWYIKLNPVFYVINGYRSALLENRWLWEFPDESIYFWIVASLLLVVGNIIFQRLKVHFADVL